MSVRSLRRGGMDGGLVRGGREGLRKETKQLCPMYIVQSKSLFFSLYAVWPRCILWGRRLLAVMSGLCEILTMRQRRKCSGTSAPLF